MEYKPYVYRLVNSSTGEKIIPGDNECRPVFNNRGEAWTLKIAGFVRENAARTGGNKQDTANVAHRLRLRAQRCISGKNRVSAVKMVPEQYSFLDARFAAVFVRILR